MRKKMLLFHALYYILSFLIYMMFFVGANKLFHTTNLGAAIVFTYGLMFVGTPIIIAVLMRFSFLKWYIDPLAAAVVPLFLFLVFVKSQMNRSGATFFEAVLKCNEILSSDGGSGWLFLIGLFLFGLSATFSFARKRGESISYKLISRFIS